MSKVVHFDRRAVRFARANLDEGDASGGSSGLARLISPAISPTMGGGLATYDGCSIEWTLLYDEIIVVIAGTFKMRHGKELEATIVAGPGDVIWVPEKTRMTYEGDEAEIFYATYPGDWRTKNGFAE